jgi:hypothetical protein
MTEGLILKSGVTIPDVWILMRAPRNNDTYKVDTNTASASQPTCLLSKATEKDSIM